MGGGDSDENSGEPPWLTIYRGTRRDISLLLEMGHTAARRYPLATAWTEAEIIRQRQAGRRKLDAAIMQITIASLLSKKAGKQFQQFLNDIEQCD